MTANFPSPIRIHRIADFVVHSLGLIFILTAGHWLLIKSFMELPWTTTFAVGVFVLSALASNLASVTYHFSTFHGHRKLLRRIDHAAIYFSISGVFTPLFVLSDTTFTKFLLAACWIATAFAVFKKVTDTEVKSWWSTASYFGLAVTALSGLPDIAHVSGLTVRFIAAASLLYTVGVAFYVQTGFPFRYAIWHTFTNLAGACLFAAVWVAV